MIDVYLDEISDDNQQIGQEGEETKASQVRFHQVRLGPRGRLALMIRRANSGRATVRRKMTWNQYRSGRICYASASQMKLR